jgi:Ca2+/Na+ antiporter
MKKKFDKYDKYNFGNTSKQFNKYNLNSFNKSNNGNFISIFKDYLSKFINFIIYHWTHNRLQFLLILSIIFIICYYIYVNYFKKEQQESNNKEQNEYLNNIVKTKIIKKRKTIPKKHETRCRIILENLFKLPFVSVRPDFLKYDKTGKNLELDMYNPDLKLALEYDGIHHRKFTEFFHKTEQDFIDQQERDQFKEEKCKDLGIILIRVPDTVKFEELEMYIKNKLDEKGIFYIK